MKKALSFLVLLTVAIFTFTTSSCDFSGRGEIAVMGSNSVLHYMELISDIFMEETGYIIDAHGGGSSAGITAVIEDAALIGVSSRWLNEKEREHCEETPIAIDGLSIAVNSNNKIQSLSIEQIRDIYSGKITSWKEVGGDDERINIITREAGSGTRDSFENLVMNGEQIYNKANVYNTSGNIKSTIENDRNAIGYTSFDTSEDRGVKFLEIDGVAPTIRNIESGDYKLFMSFLFITKKGVVLPHEAQEFIDFTLSDEGQAILASEDLIPINRKK